ncbi:hypothetical protein [uncultured Sneathiella sp.]|uniref:hypothetical protein n=1 Tax=uncultured Sneathiella sp. TaxID=879315 RepID=UPI0030D8646C
MTQFFKIAMVAALAVLLSGCFGRVQPIYNAEANPVPVKLQETSLDNIGTIIQTSAINRGWVISDAQPGKMKATLHNRTHVAVVEISYTKTSYSINYVSSVDLLYDGANIHRSYNKWIRTLQNDINKNMNVAALSA